MFVTRDDSPLVAGSLLEPQLRTLTSLADKALESAGRLIDLNMNLTKATLEHSNVLARQLITARDRQDQLSLLSAQIRPNARRILDYLYYLTTIIAAAQTDFITIVGERIVNTNCKIVSLMEGIRTAAPTGLEAMAEFFKFAVDDSSMGYREFSQHARKKINVVNDVLPGHAIDVEVNRTAHAPGYAGDGAKKP